MNESIEEMEMAFRRTSEYIFTLFKQWQVVVLQIKILKTRETNKERELVMDLLESERTSIIKTLKEYLEKE